MGAFFLGILVGWVIEWVFFTYFRNPDQGNGAGVDTGTGGDSGCQKELRALKETLQDKERDISHLHARLAMLQENTDRAARQEAGMEGSAAAPGSVADAKASHKSTVKGDDLKKVSGIGPKIAALMSAAGIDSYQKLADSDPGALKAILDEAGSHYATADPASWPEQAALLAAGDTVGLEELLASLRK